MNVNKKAIDASVKMAGSRTITPYHFATAAGEKWQRAKAILERYARNGVLEKVGKSRFRVPPN